MAEKNLDLNDDELDADDEVDEPFNSPVENVGQLISIQTLHQLRTTSLSSFTKCKNKIKAHMDQQGSIEVLRYTRIMLDEAHGDCEAAHMMFRERQQPFESETEQIKFDMWLTNVDTETQKMFNDIDEHLSTISSSSSSQQIVDTEVQLGARPRTIMTRGATKRAAQQQAGEETDVAPVTSAAKKVTFNLPAAMTLSSAPREEDNLSSAPSTMAAPSRPNFDPASLSSSNPSSVAQLPPRFDSFQPEVTELHQSKFLHGSLHPSMGSAALYGMPASNIETLNSSSAAYTFGLSAPTFTTSVYGASGAPGFRSLPVTTVPPHSVTAPVSSSTLGSRQLAVSASATDQQSRPTPSPPQSSSMPSAPDFVANRPSSNQGADHPQSRSPFFTPPFNHGFDSQYRAYRLTDPVRKTGVATLSPFSPSRSNTPIPSNFNANFAALSLGDGHSPFQSMAPSHQQLARSPDEDWISNLGNSTWRDPSSTQLGGIRPPKLGLKPFTGLAKNWPVFSSGFKMLIYDNCRSDAERLYHLRNYLPKHI